MSDQIIKVRSEVTFLLTHRCPDSSKTPPPEFEEG